MISRGVLRARLSCVRNARLCCLIQPCRGLLLSSFSTSSESSSTRPQPAQPLRAASTPGALAAAPANKIWTVPNAMTMLRMGLAPVIAWHIVGGQTELALWEFVFAGALDYGDGWVARRFPSQSSLLGTFIDPLADKALVACVAGSLVWIGALHPAIVALLVARDVALIAGGFVHRARTRPEGEGFFALSKVDYKIEPSEMSKANTALQLALISMALSHVVWGMPPEAAISGLSWLTGATTLWTWWDYFQSTGRTAIKRE